MFAKFDAQATETLGFYVYMLIDPKDQKPFYVGKGQDNRLFDHINSTLIENSEEKLKLLKLDRIREIGSENVKHVIVRYGLNESAALMLESSLIAVLNKIYDANLTNIISGHKNTETLITAEALMFKLNAPVLTQQDIQHQCVFLIIKHSLKSKSDSIFESPDLDRIYEASKGDWIIGKSPLKKLCYAIAVYNQISVGVFKIDKWKRSAEPHYNKNQKEIPKYEFERAVIDKKEQDEMDKLYKGKRIKRNVGSQDSRFYKLP